ncbi:hypothetical protein EXS73_00770 [Candidatus Pacearchaeota archaeon]|nr:hypothetical protein [Candidatus Pacearchaeota archaeon]
MHQSLEKRLRGGLLAVSIGVGSLLGSGCATNNPALNAFMNYGVAPILAADAGRSQQTVIVNAPGASAQDPQDYLPKDYARGPWALYAAGYCDENTVRSAKDIRNTFTEGETFYVLGKGPGTRYLRLEVSDEQGKQVAAKEIDIRSGPTNIARDGGFLRILGGTIPPGAYTIKMFDGRGLNSQGSFKVISR